MTSLRPALPTPALPTPALPILGSHRAPARLQTGGSPARRVAAPVLAVLVGMLALLGAGTLAAPAAAHDALTGSTPADGASVETPPVAVDLTFTNPPLGVGVEVRVTGPDGAVVSEGEPQVAGTTVSQPLAEGLSAGEYAVAWRVTSSDGHPISGETTFTAVAGAAAEDPAPVAPAEPTPTESAPTASAEPEPSPAATEDAPAEVLPDADTQTETASGGVPPWVLGVAIALVAGAVAAWAVRRRAGAGDRQR